MLEQKDIEILAQLFSSELNKTADAISAEIKKTADAMVGGLSQSTSELENEVEEWGDELTEATILDIQNFHKRLLRRFEELEASTCRRLDECNAQLESMLEEIRCDRAEANLLTKRCEE